MSPRMLPARVNADLGATAEAIRQRLQRCAGGVVDVSDRYEWTRATDARLTVVRSGEDLVGHTAEGNGRQLRVPLGSQPA